VSPMARTKAARLAQCERWLRENFPPAYPTTVEWARLGERFAHSHRGECEKVGRGLVIRLDDRLDWYSAIEILLHEFAHAVTWRSTDPLPHGSEWAATSGRIYSKWFDEDGAVESRAL